MTDLLPLLASDMSNKSGPIDRSSVELSYRIFQVHPNWSEVRDSLKWGWPMHNYGFASSFLLLSSYTFISLLTLRSHLPQKPFISTINGFILLLALSRCVCLFTDPYYSIQRMPIFIGTLLWQLGYPCLLSAFSLTQLAFNSSTKLTIGLDWFTSQLHISSAAAIHFSMILVCCVLPAFQVDSSVLFYVTQSLFVFWGLILCSTFLYCGSRFLHKRKVDRLSICSKQSPCDRLCQQRGSAIGANSSSRTLNNGTDDSSYRLLLLRPQSLLAGHFNSSPNPNSPAPKIKITDEFDQTLSYNSDTSSTSLHKHVPSQELDERMSVRGESSRRNSSTSINSSRKAFSSSNHSSHQNLSQIKGFGSVKTSSNSMSELDASGKFGKSMYGVRSEHVDKLLTKLVASAAFGVLTNILQSCLIYGPFGLTEGHQAQHVIPWFIFTSLFRFVELVFGYMIASVARQPLPNSRKHDRNSLLSATLLLAVPQTTEPP